MNYWLLKSEPQTYSIADLAAAPQRTDCWDGIRNYQARNYLRDSMCVGDQAFFYHSSCPQPGIVGIMEIVSAARPDHTQFDPSSDYYEPKSSTHNPRWYLVDVQLKARFVELIPLSRLRTMAELDGLLLLRKGMRLSIMPVTEAHWRTICALSAFVQ